MSDPTTLRTALALNAGFSIASGLLMSLAPAAIGTVVGVDATWFLRAFGLVLLGHAVILLGAVRLERVDSWAKLNLLAIAPYPPAMVAVAAFVADDSTGRALVLADGLIVGFIAGALATGLRTQSLAA
jgi:uncharacterized membrane protein YidH (DUF202 family)